MSETFGLDAKPVSPFDMALEMEGVTGTVADLARSIYQQESSGGMNTRTSNAGAVGGMQIIPKTFASVADKGWDIADPIHNSRAGIRYVKQLHDATQDPRLTAIGYYGGPNAINQARQGAPVSDPRNPTAPNTFQYAQQVLSRLAPAAEAVIPAANAAPVQEEFGLDAQPVGEDFGLDAQPVAQGPVGNPNNGGKVDGFMMGVRDPIDALAQMLRRAVPDSVGNAVDSAGNWLADKGVPIARSNGVAGVDKLVNDANAQYDADKQAAGRDGIDWSRMGGNVAGAVPFMYASGAATAPTLIGRMAVGGAQGAGFGMLNPVVGEQQQGDFWGEKGSQATTGAAFGAATPLVTGALARLISPKASTNPGVQLLRKEGVELTPGQTAGGVLNRAEEKLMSMPILGDAISYARGKGNEQLNRAVYNRVLEPIGKTTDKVGREAVDDVSRQVSQAYDDVLSRVTFTPDNAFTQQLANLRGMAANGLPQKEAEQFTKEIERNVIGPLSKGRSIDGQAFKDIETQLGNRASSFLRSTDVYQQDLGQALVQVQKSLRENLVRLNPSAAQDLQNVNQSFANLTRLQNAAGKINAEGGVFTPAQLAQSVRQGDRTVRKNAYAKGDALMQDLSDAARDRMMGKVPNSGTADRWWLGAGALGSGFYNPAIPAALAAGSLPYMPGISKAVTGAMASRPQGAQALAEQLRRLPVGGLGLLANQR